MTFKAYCLYGLMCLAVAYTGIQALNAVEAFFR